MSGRTDIERRASTEADLDQLVHDLGSLYAETGMSLAVNMGRLIIERLYRGDLKKWRSRRQKDVSFRQLERHPALPFRASTLSRAVSIYMLSLRRGDVLTLRYVSPSHLHEISSLEPERQDELIARTESEHWSVQRLRLEAGACTGEMGRRRRSQVPGFARCLRRLESDIEGRILLADMGAAEKLSIDEARRLFERLRMLLQQGEILARHLGDRVRLGESAVQPSVRTPSRSDSRAALPRSSRSH